MNPINILNKIYNVLGCIVTNISDSFVDYSIKTGYGNGETRLYISNQSSFTNGKFFEFDMLNTITVINQRNMVKNYHPCLFKGFFLKDNLIKYMQDAYYDYTNPKYNFRYDISRQYEQKLEEIQSLDDEIYFTIHKQDGSMDTDRFYIGSADFIWHKVRTYALPFVSKFIIYKIQQQETGEILYFFQLVHNSNKSNEIYTKKTVDDLLVNLIINNTTISKTEKQTLINARIGQGLFRNNCLSILNHCPFTNVYNESVLIASHIIPWSKCMDNFDRLNGFNGIMLTPFYDALFDKGLISFENDGKVLISPKITNDIITALNLTPNKYVDLNNIDGKRNRFLQYHREFIFQK